MERWYQFRHREANDLWGKLAVTVSLGGFDPVPPGEVLHHICFANMIKVVDNVQGIGAAGCHYCGYGETCKVGIPYLLQGPDVPPITQETIPDVTKDEELMQAAEAAGKKLGDMLRSPDYSRENTVQELMQMMEAMKAEMMQRY